MTLETSVLKLIKDMSSGKKGYISGRADPTKVSPFLWDRITIVPAQINKASFDFYKESDIFRSSGIYGARYSKGFELNIPFVITAMSYGAISKNAKLAIHKAANKLAEENIKIAVNTGEGGALDFELYERKYVLIGQLASGRFGLSRDYLENIDALEIKIGQGAKTGLGGHLLAKKITKEIAEQRMIPYDVDAFSPSRHIDIVGPEDLTAKILQIRSLPFWNDKPIIVKYGAADVYSDVKIAVKAGADIVAIDGMEGATGAAPISFLNYVGKHTIPSITNARKAIDDTLKVQYRSLQKYDQSVEFEKVNLFASGGIYSPERAYVAMALGADMIGTSTGVLIAMGCTACDKCSEGSCSVGIATQEYEKEKNLDIDQASQNIYNYIKRFHNDLLRLFMASGYYDYSASIKDITTTDYNIHLMTGIKMEGGI